MDFLSEKHLASCCRRQFLGMAAALAGMLILSTQAWGSEPPRVTVDSIPLVYTQSQMDSAASSIYSAYGVGEPNQSALKAQLAAGYLDVTKKPYGATPNNSSDDDWGAIQQAVYDAMRYKAACYFPTGTYHITKQISCPMPAIRRTSPSSPPYTGDIAATWYYRCVLIGDRSGERPVIQLKNGSSGFGSVSSPKDIFHFWSVYIDDGTQQINENSEKPNSNFNQRMEYLKVVTGNNAGAAGVYMWGAQGCVVEDVEVDASGGFAGMRGIPGSGGMIHGLTVTGGRYGIYGHRDDQCGGQAGATIVGATLTGQTVNNIYDYEIVGPLNLIGCRLQTNSAPNIYGRGVRAWFNLIDCQIERASAGRAIDTNRGVYLSNVYVQRASPLVYFSGQTGRNLSGNSSGWFHCNEYSQSAESSSIAPRYLNGSNMNTTALSSTESGVAPPDDLVTRHWPPEETLPHWNAANAIDITKSPYNASGTDSGDDWQAIQDALDDAQAQGKDVYVPRGTFYITRPLTLPPNVALFGVESSYSTIQAKDNSSHTFLNENNEVPMLQTEDNPYATASLAKVGIISPLIGTIPNRTPFDGLYGTRWRYGRDSYVRDVDISYATDWYERVTRYRDCPYILIDGSGGGKWYNLQRPNNNDTDDMTANYRQVKVSGTREPLAFYHFNATERTWDAPIGLEIANAGNVTVYSLKHENHVGGDPNYRAIAMYANNAKNLRFLGHSGNAIQDAWQNPRDFMYEIQNCSNFIMTFLCKMNTATNDPGWDILYDHTGSIRLHGGTRPLYFKRGTTSGVAPKFSANPLIKASAWAGQPYTGQSVASSADDEDNTPGALSFECLSFNGPGSDWLSMASNGALSGTPGIANSGVNTWMVRVTDGAGMYSDELLQITVQNDTEASPQWGAYK